jgi:hypothetical protein
LSAAVGGIRHGIARGRVRAYASTLSAALFGSGLRRAVLSNRVAVGRVAAFFLFQHGGDLGRRAELLAAAPPSIGAIALAIRI